MTKPHTGLAKNVSRLAFFSQKYALLRARDADYAKAYAPRRVAASVERVISRIEPPFMFFHFWICRQKRTKRSFPSLPGAASSSAPVHTYM